MKIERICKCGKKYWVNEVKDPKDFIKLILCHNCRNTLRQIAQKESDNLKESNRILNRLYGELIKEYIEKVAKLNNDVNKPSQKSLNTKNDIVY